MLDAEAKVLVTADGYYRRGKISELKAQADMGTEGTTECHDRSPVLRVEMCDKKAVEMVSKSWGRATIRGGKHGCLPTPQNPEGRTYVTVASGSRAQIIMKAYEPEIKETRIHQRWQKTEEECKKRKPKPS
jgi:acyl-coenzyme A synthetase/AMP-(fatty) acid ligase